MRNKARASYLRFEVLSRKTWSVTFAASEKLVDKAQEVARDAINKVKDAAQQQMGAEVPEKSERCHGLAPCSFMIVAKQNQN
jgi:hypothetical protein